MNEEEQMSLAVRYHLETNFSKDWIAVANHYPRIQESRIKHIIWQLQDGQLSMDVPEDFVKKLEKNKKKEEKYKRTVDLEVKA
jgi:hypothetical protein